MREDEDGAVRADGPDRPLPYGLPDDPQEPFVAIVAPNIDKVSVVSFDRRTVVGRRTRRGLVVFAASAAGGVVVIGIVVAAQWVMSLFGAG
ncbi:hypothetical protein IT072_11830 [Leifsonia sp. ZF2019]|uniref:hypothetical protein n=1 Tax=Leifsonia sp. ZF2019 TaxID=2781978 RepID=UPI001CBCD271|nr:hypothetical protein [Leifsonia sp. ZF2019]UAJ77979.1 hypothetical protein IT072_11830 [Leifsonia sp. ZF2019]